MASTKDVYGRDRQDLHLLVGKVKQLLEANGVIVFRTYMSDT